jgi:hypothetical protein
MTRAHLSLLQKRILDRQRELEAVKQYPVEKLADIIGEVGFSCNLCARCCTRAFNGHVLLLEEDAVRIRLIDPAAIEPPPEFDLSDQHGTFYVSGYTLKAKPGESGECHFLMDGRCRIYPDRPLICRIYPYMLHREADEEGVVDWRQVSGLDQHGDYHSPVPRDIAWEIASAVKAFECAVLVHEIAFLEYADGYFSAHGLRPVRKRFDDGMRALYAGAPVRVKVFFGNTFESWVVQGGKCTLSA